MKRVVGTLFCLVAIAVMVFAVLNYGNYRSMCFDASERAEMVEETEDLPCVEACDSLAVEPVVTPEEVVEVVEEQKIESLDTEN